jgi:hypothetical protein
MMEYRFKAFDLDFDESCLGPPPLSTTVKVMLAVWFLILIPWLVCFSLVGSGMALEAGHPFDADFFVVLAWVYPPLVAVAWFLRRRMPKMVWLPMVPIIPMILSALTNWP